MRDPAIDFDLYFDEAQAALDCLFEPGTPLSRLIYCILLAHLDYMDNRPIRQSHLDVLRKLFAKAVDAGAARRLPAKQG